MVFNKNEPVQMTPAMAQISETDSFGLLEDIFARWDGDWCLSLFDLVQAMDEGT